MHKNKAILLLENGIAFKGSSLGAKGETIGEACFNTGLTGYQEIITDPSYNGQIVAMTNPHIGNYGVNKEDVESEKVQIAGFIAKEVSTYSSNFRSLDSLPDYLLKMEYNYLSHKRHNLLMD